MQEIFKNKTVWFSGVILSIFMGLMGIISYQKCIENIGCLLYATIPLFPGIILNLTGLTSIMVSLAIWFIIGALIGLLISKLKK